MPAPEEDRMSPWANPEAVTNQMDPQETDKEVTGKAMSAAMDKFKEAFAALDALLDG